MTELFPQRTGCGSNPTAKQIITTFDTSSIGRSACKTPIGKPATSQLTIFYNGTVNVYDVVEKQAEAVLRLPGRCPARKPTTTQSTSTSNQTLQLLPLNPPKNSSPQEVLIQKWHTDFPLQKRKSLQRFLQKRKKYRMNKADPYSHSHT